MEEFAWDRLRRAPDVEAPNLFAYDATDRLLTERALAFAAEQRLTGSEIAVIGDEYGAITLRLAHAGVSGIRVHQDLATGREALTRNAMALGLCRDSDESTLPRSVEGRHAADVPTGPKSSTPLYVSHELGPDLLAGARLILVQLPKSLAELEEISDAAARFAAPDATLVAGGRVKHMTLAQNEVIGRYFAAVQPQRAERKSRLIVASGPVPVREKPPFPLLAAVDAPGGPLTLAAYGGAFAGARLDIGTRVLLEALAKRPHLRRSDAETADNGPNPPEPVDSSGVVNHPLRVIDLGCGTGALAAWFARHDPEALVTATDRSATAVRSARATMAANGLEHRVAVTHDDAGVQLPAAEADIVLLNPPFHLGTSVHTGAATRLFEAAARLLKPQGELYAVWNSSLRYRLELERLVGPTEQIARTPKFTVTLSRRR